MRKRACCSKLFFRPRGSMKRNMFSLYIFVQFSTFSLFWFDQRGEHRQASIHTVGRSVRDAACMLDPGVISTKESRAFSLFVSHQVPTKCFFVREYWIHFILQAVGSPSHSIIAFIAIWLVGFPARIGWCFPSVCVYTDMHTQQPRVNETKRSERGHVFLRHRCIAGSTVPALAPDPEVLSRQSAHIDRCLGSGGRWF